MANGDVLAKRIPDYRHRLWSKHPAVYPVTLKGNGLVYIEFRPDLDYETIRGQVGVPTLATQGLFRGFSLPLHVADNKEELFATVCVPNRYDEASDIFVHLYCWLAVENINKNFKMQVSWEHYTPGTDIVPATTAENVEVQTATGAGAQFQSYVVKFTLDYDVHTPNNVVADDIVALRMRRVAAAADECADEIVVNHYGVVFRRDKLGATTP
ncbi:hypothetical protein ES703_92881 [subsurface metagenome]